MTDQFGANLERIIQDLAKRVQKLEASQRGGPGLTVGKASGPFLLPNAGPAGNPASGVYLYVSGTTLRQRDSTGLDRPVGNSAANVIVPAITAPNAPASYNQAQAQAISDGLATTYNALIALHVTLRTGGVLIV